MSTEYGMNERTKGYKAKLVLEFEVEWHPDHFNSEEEYVKFTPPTDEESIHFMSMDMPYRIESVELFERSE